MPTVTQILKGHVTLEVECIDRLYLNGYIPKLQLPGDLIKFLVKHRNHPIPSPALLGRITVTFVEKVAPTNVPVLITGESGTGKDVVAQAIRCRSQRAAQPLIIKNCGTLQRELILSELFGYCKGAFTGATQTRDGLMALAQQGTLFMDEIGELSADVQASLLRVLENQTYRRVGEKHERQVDIRFLFATNRVLSKR